MVTAEIIGVSVFLLFIWFMIAIGCADASISACRNRIMRRKPYKKYKSLLFCFFAWLYFIFKGFD